jgi:hypothetical protein
MEGFWHDPSITMTTDVWLKINYTWDPPISRYDCIIWLTAVWDWRQLSLISEYDFLMRLLDERA